MSVIEAKGTLALVSIMEQSPGVCFICRTTPTDDDGNVLPSINPIGVDIDFGDTPYICMECCDVIADLIGRVSAEDHEKLEKKYKFNKKRLKTEVQKNELMENLLKGVKEGEKVTEKIDEFLAKKEKK